MVAQSQWWLRLETQGGLCYNPRCPRTDGGRAELGVGVLEYGQEICFGKVPTTCLISVSTFMLRVQFLLSLWSLDLNKSSISGMVCSHLAECICEPLHKH